MSGSRPPTREELIGFVDAAIIQLANVKVLLLGAELEEPEREEDPTLPEGPCPDRDGRPHDVEWTNSSPLTGIPLEEGACRACGAQFTREPPE